MGYSAGFSPHPKISYVGAAPTGVASEAEFLEIGLAREVDVQALRTAIDAALPDGLDIVDAVVAAPGSLAERIQASRWRVELPGVGEDEARAAVTAFLGLPELAVQRLTKDGQRTVDVRGPVLRVDVSSASAGPGGPAHAILELVVRQATPAVRPDDVLAALRSVAGLALAVPPIAVRLAQGPLDDAGGVGDPLATDRVTAETAP